MANFRSLKPKKLSRTKTPNKLFMISRRCKLTKNPNLSYSLGIGPTIRQKSTNLANFATVSSWCIKKISRLCFLKKTKWAWWSSPLENSLGSMTFFKGKKPTLRVSPVSLVAPAIKLKLKNFCITLIEVQKRRINCRGPFWRKRIRNWSKSQIHRKFKPRLSLTRFIISILRCTNTLIEIQMFFFQNLTTTTKISSEKVSVSKMLTRLKSCTKPNKK